MSQLETTDKFNYLCIIAGLPQDQYDGGIRFGRYHGFPDKTAVELCVGGEMELIQNDPADESAPDYWNPEVQSLEDYLQEQHDQTRVRVSTFLDEGYECEPKLADGLVIEGGTPKRYGIECKYGGDVQCIHGDYDDQTSLVYALIGMFQENGEADIYRESLAGYTYEAKHITLLGNQGMKLEYRFVELDPSFGYIVVCPMGNIQVGPVFTSYEDAKSACQGVEFIVQLGATSLFSSIIRSDEEPIEPYRNSELELEGVCDPNVETREGE